MRTNTEFMRTSISKNCSMNEICAMANIVNSHQEISDGKEYLDAIAEYVCESYKTLEDRIGDMVSDELYEKIINDYQKFLNNEKPECKLVGADGNVFNIIGIVSKTLKRAHMYKEADEFVERAMTSESYDDVLQLCFKYVDVV